MLSFVMAQNDIASRIEEWSEFSQFGFKKIMENAMLHCLVHQHIIKKAIVLELSFD